MFKKLFYTWNSIALNPEWSDASEVLDLSQLPLETAVTIAYPAPSFCELIEIQKRLQLSSPVNTHLLLRNYGYAYDSKLQSLIDKLYQLPQTFWQWCQSRSLSPRDLYPLLSLSDLSLIEPLLKTIAQMNLTRQVGSQILELLIECALLKLPQEHLQPLSQKTEDGTLWLQQLQQLRFPQTHQRDHEKQSSLLKLPWTKEIQTRWLRQGDRSGVEIRFFAASQKELQKRVQELQSVIQKESEFNDTY